MKAVVLEKPGQFQMVEMARPVEPAAGEARVRIRRVGICGTDLHAFAGNQPFFSYPRILGHEAAVEVIEAGERADGIRPGDRCALEPYLHCGSCVACRRGKTNCCASLRVLGVHLDGAMREEMTVPAAKLHASASLSLEQLALVEPLSIGAHAVSRAAPQAGESVLVVGAGPIGLAVAQSLVLAEVRPAVTDINAGRLAFGTQAFPQVHGLAGGEALPEMLRDCFSGDLPTLVFDCTGSRSAMMRSFPLVAPGGKLVFVGLFIGEVSFDDPEFHKREMTLLSSRNATAQDFRAVIEGMESGRIAAQSWITHRTSSDQLIDAFPEWLRQPDLRKAVIEW